jgi:hypothetical protein
LELLDFGFEVLEEVGEDWEDQYRLTIVYEGYLVDVCDGLFPMVFNGIDGKVD